MDRLHVATLNIRNLADRWFERLPLLLADMATLQPDLLGLQEVVYVMQQDRLIGAAGEGRYGAVRGWAGRPEYGNSLLVREPLDGGRDGAPRPRRSAARRSARVVTLPGGASVLVVVTHLHHLTPDETLRDEQTAAILAWLDAPDAPAADATIVMGDFNADPDEPAAGTAARPPGSGPPTTTANGAEPGRDLAVRAPGAGDGHRRAAGLPRLHLGPRRRARRVRAARLRPAGPRGPDHLPERSPRDRGLARRSGRGDGSSSAPSASPIAATGGPAPENSIAAFTAALAVPGLRRPRIRRPRRRPTASRSSTTTPRSPASTAGRNGSTRMTRPRSATSACRRCADVLAAVGRRAFLDVELKGDPGGAVVEVLAAGRGPALENAVVSSFERAALERDRPPRADLAALAERLVAVDPATVRDGDRARLSRGRPRLAGHRRARRSTRRGRPGSRSRPTPSAGGRRSTGWPASGSSRSAPRRRPSMAERADLVVVGAGTVGGWASVFARADGVGRVVVVERGQVGGGRVVARGGHRPRAGRHADDGRARSLVDRLLQRRSRPPTAPTRASASSAT